MNSLDTDPKPRQTSFNGPSVPIQITETGGKQTIGSIVVRRWAQNERTTRAAKRLALFWALAVVAVFVPVLHFILVPVLLIAGPVLAALAWKETEVVSQGHGTCPNCAGELQFQQMKPNWPAKEICVHCRHQLSIQPLEQT